jgi:hypothetical protein
MTNPMQPLDPIAANDPVTPHDTPSSPAGFAMVTPHGQGPAPYDIQAPQGDLTGEYAAAGAITGAGIVYTHGPRQALTETLMQSPAGFAVDGYDIDAGYPGSATGEGGWPTNVEPPGM